MGLLKFLFAQMPEKSRTAVKSLLEHRQISVGGETITQFNHPLVVGQTVEIRRAGDAEHAQSAAKIIFEDTHLIVIEKRAGLLSIATEMEREKTAYSLLSEHVKRAHSRNRIFVIHRLDRETSGLMMFAKNQDVQAMLQGDWRESVLERTYVAVVEGLPAKPQGTVTSWLKENKSLQIISSPTPDGGQKAVTHYRLLRSGPKYSLVELTLETGRKNQIRVHMQDLGHSVVGDKKYGAANNPIRRLALHAQVLSFRHPVTGKTLRFESPMPKEFTVLL
ncbi:MAG TPA: RluA family pseudouridine synthase [Verrucomicrobiae bacterium]|jgi:23S rRNA pseudouridine1911/1915/1917 synthase|nr:RluA family pseudouridine synthase [Verrucomicrobiae bacterium]